MQVRVIIERGGRPAIVAGTIRLENGLLTYNPKYSNILGDILGQPLSLSIEGRVRDLYADADPTLFLQSLHLVYAGPFLRVTPVECAAARNPDLPEPRVSSSRPQPGDNGHIGSGQPDHDKALLEQPLSPGYRFSQKDSRFGSRAAWVKGRGT